jgi:hypothetical protein
MDAELLASLTPFGTAGLVAAMWIIERRAAAERERQLTSAHERLMEQRTQLDALLSVVSDNTRAVAAIEAAVRSIAAAVDSPKR